MAAFCYKTTVNTFSLDAHLRILYWHLFNCEGQRLQVLIVKKSVALMS